MLFSPIEEIFYKPSNVNIHYGNVPEVYLLLYGIF